jgi:hypothetical protein
LLLVVAGQVYCAVAVAIVARPSAAAL